MHIALEIRGNAFGKSKPQILYNQSLMGAGGDPRAGMWQKFLQTCTKCITYIASAYSGTVLFAFRMVSHDRFKLKITLSFFPPVYIGFSIANTAHSSQLHFSSRGNSILLSKASRWIR